MDHQRSGSSAASASRSLRLASVSPRRRLLLPLLGFPVSAVAVETDETPRPGEAPAETARRLALAKARVTGPPGAGVVVVGADTIVVLEGRQLGKPATADEARSMLVELRGRSHQVVSGVALVGEAETWTGTIATRVWMRAYAERELERYVASGRPLDKAGAYAIQDVDFGPVERIDGCYLNVVGLPLCEVSRGLRSLGWPLPDEPYVPPCCWCRLGQAALG